MGLEILILVTLLHSEVFFKEEFDYAWRSRWVESSNYDAEDKRGRWGWEGPKKYYNREQSKGIKTLDGSKFYQITADIGKTISNANQTLILSYTVHYTESITCAGSYIKLLPEKTNQVFFSDRDHYNIMFGPDYCGSMNDKVNALLRKNHNNHQMRDTLRSKRDKDKTHLYTLILRPDFTFEIHVDDKVEKSGNMVDSWSYFQPKFIYDPTARRPADWDDVEQIEDPNDFKPADWDQPKSILDPDSVKPEDWNDTIDGRWIAPRIKNPAFKGEWKRRIIQNPNYMGTWEAPFIRNPKLTPQLEAKYPWKRIRYIGIDVWQVEAGTIFDNFFLGNNEAEYKAFVQTTWRKQHDVEEGLIEGEKEKKPYVARKKPKLHHHDDDEDL